MFRAVPTGEHPDDRHLVREIPSRPRHLPVAVRSVARSPGTRRVVGLGLVVLALRTVYQITATAAQNASVIQRRRGEVQLTNASRNLFVRVTGPLGPVVAVAANHDLVDLVSREPSLEQTFLALYAPGDGRPIADGR
jgi:hypothetical protein